MNLEEFIKNENEKPLDNIVSDGGFTSIFRTIACIGDSLSSGEFESLREDGGHVCHDMFEFLCIHMRITAWIFGGWIGSREPTIGGFTNPIQTEI